MNLARISSSFLVIAPLLAAALPACSSSSDNGGADTGISTVDSTVDSGQAAEGGDESGTDAVDETDASVGDADATSGDTNVDVADVIVIPDVPDGDFGAGLCVPGTTQSCHMVIHSTEAGIIDCTTAKQTCLSGTWSACGVDLSFCPSSTLAQTVTFYTTSDAPKGFGSSWNSMVTNTPFGTQLFFDRLTTSPATPTIQILQAGSPPSIGLKLRLGGPITAAIVIDPSTRIVHGDQVVGDFSMLVQDVSQTFTLPIAAYTIDGILDGNCLSTDAFSLEVVIPQSAGVLGFQSQQLASLLGPTNTTAPVTGWAVNFTTTKPGP
jgi:hypothetical protein